MFQRLVGLDIGSTSIKVAYVQRGLKGVAVERCVHWPVPPQGPEPGLNGGDGAAGEVLAASLSRAGLRLKAGREILIAALPQRRMYTRRVQLPFSDPNQVAQALPYELEAQLPVELDEVVVDYHPIAPLRPNGTGPQGLDLLAAALPKRYLRERLDLLQKNGLDPKAFEVDCLALYNFFRHYFPERQDTVALLDIGAAKTSVCIVSNGRVQMIRTIWVGGQAITESIARSLGIGFEEAEERKRQADLEAPAVSDEGLYLGIQSGLRPLIQELTQTLHAHETAFGGPPVRFLYLSGGTVRLKGLAPYLCRTMETEWLRGPGLPDEELFAVAIGLALKGCLGARGSQFRFRTGEFAFQRESRQSRRQRVALGVGMAALLLLGSADLYTRYYLKEARYRELRVQVRDEFHKVFPEVRTIVNELEQARAAMQSLEKKEAFLGGGDLSALDLLAVMTARIPGDVEIEVQDLLIEKNTLRLEARTGSFEAAERIQEALRRAPEFEAVSITDAKMSADQSSVRFQMNIQLRRGV